ncbi:hypothetical protein ABE527_11700 [Brucella sp. TWI432]
MRNLGHSDGRNLLPKADMRKKGAWFLFLPPNFAGFNPIEMAFSKLKVLLRKRTARNFEAITKALGDIISLFSAAECRNFFKAD